MLRQAGSASLQLCVWRPPPPHIPRLQSDCCELHHTHGAADGVMEGSKRYPFDSALRSPSFVQLEKDQVLENRVCEPTLACHSLSADPQADWTSDAGTCLEYDPATARPAADSTS